MRTQQAVHESAIRSATAPPTGAVVPFAQQPGKPNDNAPRSDSFSATASETAKAAVATPVPVTQPTAGFLAQLISQDGLNGGAVRPETGTVGATYRTGESPLAAQRRHYRRIDAYRRSQNLATPSRADEAGSNPVSGASPRSSARVVKIDV